MKTACIIQGNIRNGFELVLKEMQKHFDVVIVSTWEDENEKVPNGSFIKIFHLKPEVAGYSHRNFQRYSTVRGIEKAKELGCEYVFKCRTDILFTKLNVSQLIKWANYDVPNGLKSRVVTCAYRNLTVYEDWFSSIPDLFAFGHIETMELLWGDDGFDYNKMMNPPQQMLLDEGAEWMNEKDAGGMWCAESELYAIFKDRLQKKLNLQLTHEIIAKNYMQLFDHNKLGIVWFGENNKFRPIFQAWEHPWWSEKNWKEQDEIIYVNRGYKLKNFKFIIRGKFNWLTRIKEIYIQHKTYKGFIDGKY